jgi:putative ABC transport system permease protein
MTHWKTAFRSLARRPAFAFATILILGLGIGATTTLFSLIDTVLWKPLPYPSPDQLVTVYEANPAKNQNTALLAPARIEDWNRLNQSFSAISGSYSENVTDTSTADPDRMAARRVSPRYFQVFGTTPVLGRWFSVQEDTFGGPGAAILSFGLWQRRFHGSQEAIGKSLVFSGQQYTVVGVMPDGFADPRIDLWLPAQLFPGLMQARDARFFGGVGRMKPGVTPKQAQDDLARVQADLGRQFPKTDLGWSAQVTDLKDARVGEYRSSLSILFAAVVLLLLIACANSSGLMLGQLHRREREMAIRASLGASRGALIAVVVREAAILVVAGAALGLALALGGVNAARAAFGSLPRIDQAHLDARALAFTITVSLAAILLSSLGPALATLRADVSGRLYQATRTQTRGRKFLQRALVASQFAVTLVLLAGAGLLVRSYSKLTGVAPGFEPTHVISFHMGAEWGENRGMIGKLQQSLLQELKNLPGVEAAGMANFLPATGATLRYEFQMQGSSGDLDTGKLLAGQRSIFGDYLQAMHIPVVEGQSCPPLKTDLNAPVGVLVNRRFVDLYAKGMSVVGRGITTAESRWNLMPTIVGVVANAKEDGLDAPAYPFVYMCLAAGAWPDPEYVVRTSGDPRQVLGGIRQAVHNVAPNRAVFGVRTLAETLDTSLDKPRLNAEVVALFAASALTLAAVGLYSLMMLAVTAQTREIGVRVALGATPGRIVSAVVNQAVRPVLAGVAIGAGIAALVLNAKVIRSELFGVSPGDGVTLLAVTAVLASAALLAALIPARRAAGIDPIQALREE